MDTSRLQCALCLYTTHDFHTFLVHPCAERLFAQQKQPDRTRSRYRLDELLFCAVCGSPRRKADEDKRRAGKMGGMHLGYQCWICQTPYDEDWSFLDRLYCLREGEVFWLACPHPQCRGQLGVTRTNFVPVLSWFHGRRNGPQPHLWRPSLNWDCPVCDHSFAAQDMLHRNRWRLIREIETSFTRFERSYWDGIGRKTPFDERLSGEPWRQQEALWAERAARIEQTWLEELKQFLPDVSLAAHPQAQSEERNGPEGELSYTSLEHMHMAHTAVCYAARAQDTAWVQQWPDHCKKCEGRGQMSILFDPSPAGVGSAPAFWKTASRALSVLERDSALVVGNH